MSRSLTPELLSQIFAQESDDPFLILLTLTHPTFAETVRLVNNTVDIVSNGNQFKAYPFKIVLPADDGETQRTVSLTLDNASLELIDEIRSVTTPIEIQIDLILASDPDTVQVEIGELRLKNVTYDKTQISGSLTVDDFLNVEMTSEKYTPSTYPGLF